MLLEGRSVEIEGVVIGFRPLSTGGACLEVHSPAGDSALGGVALNGLEMEGASCIQDLFGRRIVVDVREQDDAELAESVMWAPGGASLELARVEICLHATPLPSTVGYEIRAECFDDRRTGIGLALSGTAPLREALAAFIARASPHIRELWAEEIGARRCVYGRLNAIRPALEFETVGGRIYLEAQDGAMSRRGDALLGRYLCAEIEKRSPSALQSRQKWQLVRIAPISEDDLC